MKKFFAFSAVTIPAMLYASQPLEDALQPSAVKVAQEHGASELGCPAATTEVISKHAEAPHRAIYAVTVKGCGKQTGYLVECDTGKQGCATAGSQPSEAGSQRPQLTDELQPSAVQAAQERGSKELECPAATAKVNRKETIEEAQTTGWYEPPYRALYTLTVSGH